MSSPSTKPKPHQERLGKSLVWFALGMIVMGAIGAVSFVGWLDSRIDNRVAARKAELKGDKGESGDKGDAGVAPAVLEDLRVRVAALEEGMKKLAWYKSTFDGVVSSPARMAALQRFSTAPPTGWAIYGEPCHDTETGHNHQDPLMHNRQFDAKPENGPLDKPPVVKEVVVAREFVTVWPTNGGPKYNDKDTIFGYGPEQYPDEATAPGVLVPGQEVRIVRVHPIKYGFTFIEFKLEKE